MNVKKLSKEDYEIKRDVLAAQFDQRKITLEQQHYKAIDKAWKLYKQKLARYRIG